MDEHRAKAEVAGASGIEIGAQPVAGGVEILAVGDIGSAVEGAKIGLDARGIANDVTDPRSELFNAGIATAPDFRVQTDFESVENILDIMF